MPEQNPITNLLDQLLSVLTDDKYLELIDATASASARFYKALIAGGMPTDTAHEIVVKWNPMSTLGGNQNNA